MVVGKKYTVSKDRERAFPLHLAVLMVDSEWNFYGYCVLHSAVVANQKTQIEFEVLTFFSSEVGKLYKDNFVAAAKMTGEI